MKKNNFLMILFSLFLTFSLVSCQSANSDGGEEQEEEKELAFTLIWEEQFDQGSLDTEKWDRVTRSGSDWNKYMSQGDSLLYFEDGNLVLEGRKNLDLTSDNSQYVTAGVWGKGKFDFKYGKVEIKAKLGEAQGAWPAFWMLPVSGSWPDAGEVDIMEHLNFDTFVYQTNHTNYTYNLGMTSYPKNSATTSITRNDYNVYAVEWSEDAIKWYVNGSLTLNYPRLDDATAEAQGQWPYNSSSFYIILSQQLGGTGTWVGEIDDADLPVKMWIDYVKVYELDE